MSTRDDYEWRLSIKGGPGSGNWGHAGRPGKVGGSMPRDVAMSRVTGRDWQERQQRAAGQGQPAINAKDAFEARAALRDIDRDYSVRIMKLEAEDKVNAKRLEELAAKTDKSYGTPEYDEYAKEMSAAWDQELRYIEEVKALKLERLERAREVLYVDNPAKANLAQLSRFDKERWARYERGMDEFNKFVGTGTVDGLACGVKAKRGKRAHANWDGKSIEMVKQDGTWVAVHELGHWLEFNDPAVKTKALDFYNKRTKGESLEWLGDRYRKDEFTRKDRFPDPYSGKNYNGRATEIISMGLQSFYDDPIKFANDDPDYFNFVYNTLRGR